MNVSVPVSAAETPPETGASSITGVFQESRNYTNFITFN